MASSPSSNNSTPSRRTCCIRRAVCLMMSSVSWLTFSSATGLFLPIFPGELVRDIFLVGGEFRDLFGRRLSHRHVVGEHAGLAAFEAKHDIAGRGHQPRLLEIGGPVEVIAAVR